MTFKGRKLRPLRHYEVSSLYKSNAVPEERLSLSHALLLRKLKVESVKLRLHKTWGLNPYSWHSHQAIKTLNSRERVIQAPNTTLTPLQNKLSPPIDPDVLDALYNIQAISFNNSFVSRLQGTKDHFPVGLISIDWEIRTPWMELMVDIRNHFSLAQCVYLSLSITILSEVLWQPWTRATKWNFGTHHLLFLKSHSPCSGSRSPWAVFLAWNRWYENRLSLYNRIWLSEVSDSLEYQPEKATVLALYKRVVVGVAILKSPQETYIMYLAVKGGWDKSQIAR